MEIGLAAGLAWFAIVFVLHFIVLWTTTPSARPRISQWVFLLGFVGILFSLMPQYIDRPTVNAAMAYSALGGVLVYGGLLTLYLPFYYSIVASLSLQTIILLNEQANYTLSNTTLRQRFSSRQLVAQRLETMARNGFIVERDSGYCLTVKGRMVAKIFLFFKHLWRLGPGG
jgi:hypothetical protein